MIDPTVEIVDCDPGAMAWINRVMRGRRSVSEISVVVEDGTVRQIAGDAGRHLSIGDRVDDPVAVATRLRTATGVDQVTVIDAQRLEDIPARLVKLARGCRSQGELLWRSRELWNTHPAVTIDPAPAPSRWRPVAEFLATVPEETWLVVSVRDGARTLTIGGQVRAGLIVRITSAIPDDAVVAARLDTPGAGLADAICAPDPLSALAALLASPQVTQAGLETLKL